MIYSAEQMIEAVRQAGVVGAGGGGFPTHVKLQAKVETIIANGSECEPLLSSDRTMMIKSAAQLIDGLTFAMQMTGAKEAIIGLKAHYEDAVDALKKVLPKNNSIRLHLLNNYYPAGDEFLLVYEVTQKIIPEGGIPLHVGIVVSNVITFMQIADAINGKPVTDRTVTLAGEFRKPQIINVPIGTPYRTLIEIAGGVSQKDIVFVDGGPMMGKIIHDLDQGVAKTTSGVLALPKDHFIVRMQEKTVSQMIKLSKSACCQCFRCTDLCPRNLMGHELFPHMTMRTIDYQQADAKHVTSAFLCSQCGVCELLACDFMLLSPRKIFAAYRKKLVEAGVKNPHNKKPVKTNSQFNYRKLSIPMVMKKLDLTKYDAHFPYAGLQSVSRVNIALNKHAGAPALPLVKLGQKVKCGDKIAETPREKLGTTYHASIDGIIEEMGNNYIVITKQKS